MKSRKEKIKHFIKSPAFSSLWKWSQKQHFSLLVLGLGQMLLAGFELSLSLIIKELVDGAVDKEQNKIVLFGIILASIMALYLAVYFGIRMLRTFVTADLKRSIRRKVLHSLLYKQYGSLCKYHSGELVNRIFSDVNIVVSGVTDIIPELIYIVIELVGASIILARLDLLFVLMLIGAGILSFILMILFKPKISKLHKQNQKMEGSVHSSMQETLENVRLIKASGSEERIENKVEKHQTEFMITQMKKGRFSAQISTVMGVIFRGSWAYAMIWGCFGIYRGVMSYGTLTAIMQLVGQLQSPFSTMTSSMSSAYGTIASAERLIELCELPDEQGIYEEKMDNLKAYSDFVEIKCENMNFSYELENEILKNVSFSIKKGDFVAVTGLSGGGKSTLFQLLLGMYRPDSGKLELKFKDYSDIPSRKNRGLFAYVPQGNTLFSGTLRENLTMFCDRQVSDKEIFEIAEKACIGSFIKSLDLGLSTVIGERGVGLSEGQAQRIAVARALLSSAPILLLDESTSALDEITEYELLKNISEMKNKTCLIVTHRKAALDICSYYINIKEGRVLQGVIEK